jgi:hypothetical protein
MKEITYVIKVFDAETDVLDRIFITLSKKTMREYLNHNVNHNRETAFVKKIKKS